jgi:hypothetical protein
VVADVYTQTSPPLPTLVTTELATFCPGTQLGLEVVGAVRCGRDLGGTREDNEVSRRLGAYRDDVQCNRDGARWHVRAGEFFIDGGPEVGRVSTSRAGFNATGGAPFV